jgi:uncharacterized protein
MLIFEWDEKKRQQNIHKHAIDFADVPEIFKGPMLVSQDLRMDYFENRWIGIGMMKKNVVVIVFTEPSENIIRIITARKALKHEEKTYKQEILDRF